ncbi:PREDICTED: DNA repair protein complementing XP-G cells homolog [Nanorana parkeri]|uniref:DNA repair protein complementing XP-G cells homolog n=1 Tax=Nanorana parkeri TaxID=125878 RepID=UPI000853FE53|nr:PREDICTED: DNA repair protein complementing XP-G cells homolog [Nanorana parkeri]
MGVQGLWKLLECSGRPINPETLEGKILAVDISIWLNQAVKGARDRQGNAIQNAHLLTLFHRLCKLLFFRIRPIFVFDGEAPLLKKQTLAKRRQRKDVAANEVKKTNDRLLKTFLKRQAIKAALSGNKQSNEALPSLPKIRRKEEEDIYALAPLEENERNSSEEEEEKEWQDRMNHKRILQEEFFADPHSVDVDSEDFTSLPPEVKHEILTDMKEFTKRRRTLFEAMPEGSDDFSQYQLKGLLKKNDLNRCLNNVRKEMSQQHVGEVRAQFETDGGFMKEVECNRLVSEDTSHYILIKGIQSKTKDKKEDNAEEATPSSSQDATPKTYLDFKLQSAHKSKKTKYSVPEAAPPSPRTLFAIQEAMLENISDDEVHDNKVPKKDPSKSVCTIDGSVSPRTLHAIQQALAEDEEMVNRKRSVVISDEEEEQPRAKVLIISSSDEEDASLVTQFGAQTTPIIPAARAEFSPKPAQDKSNASNEKSPLNSVSNLKHSKSLSKLVASPLGVDFGAHLVKRNIFHSRDTPVDSSLKSLSSGFVAGSPMKPSVALESHQLEASTNVEGDMVISSETKTIKIKSHGQADFQTIGNESKGILQSATGKVMSHIHLPKVSSSGVLSTTNKLLTEIDIEAQSLPDVVLLEQKVTESKVEDSSSRQPSSSNAPDIAYVPMTPESIPVTEGDSDVEKEVDSDSDGSFIEVESDLGDGNSQLVQAPETSNDIIPVTTSRGSDLATTSQSSGTHIENSLTENDHAGGQDVELQQNEESRDEEDAVNEWQDISMEELETLENNLFVQQTSLQAQRQQQERVAASVTGQMYLESQELLRLFGIPYVVAPMEAEAQCAVLDLTDQTSGTITDDSDIWLFGARHVYKNFFSQNKYVEYYQFCDIQNQLGLERSKLINLAYLMGSDYTEGISSVGFVSAMEILNEFPGHGLEPLLKFKEWWTEAQKNKKSRPNPKDTKVKKKLRDLELHPSFPNTAVADAYLKPVVDESEGVFSWGRPDLEQIREFCESRFGWYRSKTDEVLLPVLKQLNAQQTQLRIDSFLRIERHEAHTLKSQRLRRAVTCMKRKEKDSETAEVEEATALLEKDDGNQKGAKSCKSGKKKLSKKMNEAEPESPNTVCVEGGFIGSGLRPMSPDNKNSSTSSDSDSEANSDARCNRGPKTSKDSMAAPLLKRDNVETSSSSENEEKVVLVTAKPVFQGKNKKPRTVRGRKR